MISINKFLKESISSEEKQNLNSELQRLSSIIKHIKSIKGPLSKKDLDTLNKAEKESEHIKNMLHESSHEISEALDIQQRMKRRAIMRKNKSKIIAGRRKAAHRTATTNVLKSRAMRAARAAIGRKLLGGKSKADASNSQKANVERQLAKRKNAIMNLSRRLMSQVRKKEQQKHVTKK